MYISLKTCCTFTLYTLWMNKGTYRVKTGPKQGVFQGWFWGVFSGCSEGAQYMLNMCVTCAHVADLVVLCTRVYMTTYGQYRVKTGPKQA